MSDSAVLDRLHISQGNRSYLYRWSGTPPIALRAIVAHSANMHIIPASDAVARQLEGVRVGQIVSSHGQLARAEADDGWCRGSSMSRHDTGDGACERVWVEALSVR